MEARLPVLKSRFTPPSKLLLLVVFLYGSAGLRLAAQATAGQAPAQAPARPSVTPEQLAERAAAMKDHQLTMAALGIKELRPAASRDPKSPNAVNYDESKANQYPNTLPDPLK